MKTSLAVAVLATVLLLLPGAGNADLSSGLAAFDRGDYAKAHALLSDPSLAGDGEALMTLARMAHEGRGGPVDEEEAYVHLTRIIMLGLEDQADEAVGTRLLVATGMSRDEILLAERRLADLVEAEWGGGALAAELAAAIQALESCTDRCARQAQRLGALGPAARSAIPALEAIMTRDPYWLSRAAYVNALYTIGTASVPALCRIAEDKAEFARSGAWNLTQVAFVLRAMGPAAAGARTCLIRVMSNLPGERAVTPGRDDEAAGFNVLLREGEMAAAQALIDIGDPDREAQDAVRAAFGAAGGFKAIMLSVVLGLTYGEVQPAMDVSRGVLRSGSSEDKAIMLSLLLHLSTQPEFASRVQTLRPALAPLSQDDDPALGAMATRLLEIIGGD